MNVAVAAQSGWGKSAKAQEMMEKNAPEYERLVVLDYKDEFRGLVKADLASWLIVGPEEASWSTAAWREVLRRNPRIVLARYRLSEDEWKEVAARIIAAARDLGDVLIAVDEAHFVAPQRGKIPDAVKGLATTGRGEGASSMWITQRLTELEETVLAQCQARVLGGFEGPGDLDKISPVIGYPAKLHNPQEGTLRAPVPEELRVDGESIPLRKFEDEDGNTCGSEWVYSDNSGERRRIDTRGMFEDMQSEHYGLQGKEVKV